MKRQGRGAELADWVADARGRTLEVYADLDACALRVPQLTTINPPIWELGHVAWFQELWVLRHALGLKPLHDEADTLWDSARVPHASRWELPLPSRTETHAYLEHVRDRVLDALPSGDEIDARLEYFVRLSVFHEDMHSEAMAYTRQSLGWPAPPLTTTPAVPSDACADGDMAGDAAVPASTHRLGAEERSTNGFVFDNEKWAHDVELPAFHIALAPVTQAQFAEFVGDNGYGQPALWSSDGWAWRAGARAEQPVYWRGNGDQWERRVFDEWQPVSGQPNRPMIHVNAHEAEAWCTWAGRRLPSEGEWERAAMGASKHGANLHWSNGDTVNVAAGLATDSTVGCRQMVGNVWEWTASAFLPYPGFRRDPYAEYSQPWFGNHRVLRGGCFATRARLLRPTFRNFYTPDRRDVWAGFRTCRRD